MASDEPSAEDVRVAAAMQEMVVAVLAEAAAADDDVWIDPPDRALTRVEVATGVLTAALGDVGLDSGLAQCVVRAIIERDEARRQRDELLEAIEAMGRATSSGLLRAAEVEGVHKALYDTAKKIREEVGE